MSVELLFNPADFDIKRPIYGKEQIRRWNPQRYELEMLDGVLLHDTERQFIVGFYEVKANDWWCRGHFPDRPMLPGVLALEATGQLCSIFFHSTHPNTRMGLGAIDNVKFRRPMEPPTVLYLGAKLITMRNRFAKFAVQGIVNGEFAYEAVFTGAAI